LVEGKIPETIDVTYHSNVFFPTKNKGNKKTLFQEHNIIEV